MDAPICRAARGLLGWTADDLAREGRIGVATVRRFELGEGVRLSSVEAMKDALERGGVEFIAAGATVRDGKGSSGAGVRLRG
jgi:transcriptional regulator with XRE-family HTH domain